MNQPFFSFQWHITDACDQRCRHCYIYADNPGRIPQHMNWDEINLVLENCEEFCHSYGYQPYFFVTGGDPILHPDFWRLLGLFHQKAYPFVIMGNPFHLDRAVCRRLKKLGCRRYQLSLDGLEETHDSLRKPGSFRETMDKIRLLNRSGLASAVMTTVSHLNIGEMPDIIDTAAAAEVRYYSFARYCPIGEETGNGITPQAYRSMLEACGERIRSHIARGCRTHFDKKDHLWTLLDYEQGRFTPSDDAQDGVIYDGCHCGISHLTIVPDGSVYACRRIPGSRVGNAFTGHLRDLWLNPMDAYRQYMRFERCADCILLGWCRGCPAVAAGTAGSFYSADPQCWKT